MSARYFVFVIAVTLFAGCATTPSPAPENAPVQVAERSKERAKKKKEKKAPRATPTPTEATPEIESSPTPLPTPPPEPTDDSIPVETLDVPPDQLDPIPPDENPDPPLEPEDIAVRFPPGALALDHGILQIAFSTQHKIALYAKYELTAKNLRERFIDRDEDPFAPDPILLQSVPEAAATRATYTRSGYDRGHLAPAEDMSFNADAFFASFFMSNMAPQKGDLNRKSWKVLEERVRDWACGEERVTVITGPLLGVRPRLLKNRVPVPEGFFKIIVDETPPRKIAAFIYEQNTAPETTLRRQQVSPLQIEKRAGLRLFPKAIPRVTPLEGWKSARCPEKKLQVSAKRLLRERKKAERLGTSQD